MNSFKQWALALIQRLQNFADRFWYAPLIGLLAALDNLVLVIPTDGVLISSSMLMPKHWLRYAICVAVGSAVGAFVLASFVEWQGLPFIQQYFPEIIQGQAWQTTSHFFGIHGLWVVFVVALLPIPQQPAVLLASLANVNLVYLIPVIFFGRLIKFLIMAYIGSHAPQAIGKLWGMRGELREVGIDAEKNQGTR